jgi:hypothetical protein
VFPAAAVADDRTEAELHLTRSPYCSSLLEPDRESLADWAFAPLFEVERTARVPCMPLRRALEEAGVARVDWFKTDSQGTDLRLFQSLDPSIRRRVLAAEFEPGIIDAYRGEDKLSAVLDAMDREGFWLAALAIHGTARLPAEDAARTGASVAHLALALGTAPGWGEMTYLNAFRDASAEHPRRDWLLGWVIGWIHDQPGYALDLARRGRVRFGDEPFGELVAISERTIEARLRRPGTLARDGVRRLRSTIGRWLRG